MRNIKQVQVFGNYVRFQMRVPDSRRADLINTTPGLDFWVMTHRGPHLDELVAAVLIERFGTSTFVMEHGHNGVIHLGVLNGKFDEHPGGGKQRKQGDCTATLVAKALGVQHVPLVKTLLSYVLNNDTKGRDQKDGLATAVNLINRMNSDEPLITINWARLAITAKLTDKSNSRNISCAYIYELLSSKDPMTGINWKSILDLADSIQNRRFGQGLHEFRDRGEVKEIDGPDGRKLRLAIIESDNTEMGRVARYKKGGDADLALQINSKGQVTIHTNRRANLKLFNLVRILRYEEQKARGEIKLTNWRKLSDEGIGPCGVWYYQHSGQFVLNGSLTAPMVPATALSLERIVELVQIGINPGTFEPSRQELCREGACTSSKDDPCPWFAWGLQWCQAVRSPRG